MFWCVSAALIAIVTALGVGDAFNPEFRVG